MITMYDSTSVEDLPAGAAAYAGYVDGSWPTMAGLRARFPDVPLLSITALGGTTPADCVDSEPGDVPPPHVSGWVLARLAAGAWRPVVYCSQSVLPAILADLALAGVGRGQVRLWTAHYDRGEHLCSPTACGAAATADGTQWADHGPAGEHYDMSTLTDQFFTPTTEADTMSTRLITAASGPAQGHAYASDGLFVRAIPSEDGIPDGVTADWWPDGTVHTIGQDTFDTLIDANALAAQLTALAADLAVIKAQLDTLTARPPAPAAQP